MMNRKRIIAILLLVSILAMFYISGNAVYDVGIAGGKVTPEINDYFVNGKDGGSGHFITRYKNIAVFIGGLATITMVGAVIYNIFRLNTSGGNPMQRQQSIRGILICGVCVALLGGATMFIGLFWGTLR